MYRVKKQYEAIKTEKQVLFHVPNALPLNNFACRESTEKLYDFIIAIGTVNEQLLDQSCVSEDGVVEDVFNGVIDPIDYGTTFFCQDKHYL